MYNTVTYANHITILLKDRNGCVKNVTWSVEVMRVLRVIQKRNYAKVKRKIRMVESPYCQNVICGGNALLVLKRLTIQNESPSNTYPVSGCV